MFDIFDTIISFFDLIVDFIVGFFSTFVYAFTFIFQGIVYVFSIVNFLPSWVMPFVLAVIAWSVISLLINK